MVCSLLDLLSKNSRMSKVHDMLVRHKRSKFEISTFSNYPIIHLQMYKLETNLFAEKVTVPKCTQYKIFSVDAKF